MELREIKVEYSKDSKIHQMYEDFAIWVHHHNGAVRLKKKKRLSNVLTWKGRRIKKQIFLANPNAVWVQKVEMKNTKVVVTILEEVKE